MQKNKLCDEMSFREMADSNLAAAVLAAVCARIFFLITIDTPSSMNGAYLQLLMGAAYSCPAILLSYLLLRKYDNDFTLALQSEIGANGFRALLAGLGILLLYEEAAVIRMLTGAAEYATLYDAHSPALLLPTAFAIIYTVVRGANGVGGASAIFLRVFPVLYGIVIFAQLPDMDIKRLFPLLGPGLETICQNAVPVSFYFCLIPLSMLLRKSGGDKRDSGRLLKRPEGLLILFGICVASVFALLVMNRLSYPVIPSLPHTRSVQMNALLANGKASRGVQLPIMILWFSGIFISAVFTLYTASAFLTESLRKKQKRTVIVCGVISALIALFRLSLQDKAIAFSRMAAYAMLALLPLIMLLGKIRRGIFGET